MDSPRRSASPETEVLVVGAGPAGCIAAIELARAGVRVRLVDRARFPREKLCGDTLNPGALSLLDGVGVGAAVRARALRVAGMIVSGPGGTQVAARYGDGCFGAAITRRELDALLLEEAVRAGADFAPGVGVREALISDGRVAGVRAIAGGRPCEMRARVVVAAEGRHSRLAFRLGLTRYADRPRRWAFGAYFSGVEGLTSFGEMHIRDASYIGVAPVPGGLTNVCVVRELDARVRADWTGAAPLVDRAVASDPLLRERFARARRVTPVSVLGPLAVDARAGGAPGLLLAGDAAGFVDPMTGDGLRFAIRGAQLAADAARQELTSGKPMHAALAGARRRAFAGKWRMNRALRALVASPRGVRAATAVAAWWEAPFRRLIVLAGDVRATA